MISWVLGKLGLGKWQVVGLGVLAVACAILFGLWQMERARSARGQAQIEDLVRINQGNVKAWALDREFRARAAAQAEKLHADDLARAADSARRSAAARAAPTANDPVPDAFLPLLAD